ncbi:MULTISPECIES: enoyl-CoA hydratase/isomerase family protein [Aeromicrobium]|uniref:enoyl-CoA hydratase/isomerase family protein n=1 Tax=Aeromicrobium TaxID=2040 RepID=UPI0006F8F47F|nr:MULTISPECIES: enoyl-CoA hydratase/isomerase family protein [Aeromicrobium]KQX74170.1 enoyl-CoA hydratase [Aeromicrobium sp. Root472D3]MBD8608352.1 enoyl-CoA hydratase/isomerase family protein [Aeromicrobium sp. CFBP 8757]MCL8249893.1 enoyl-CoA hydratase/isomerase family protein [Aeromicrobium fastidiosum]
MSVTVERVDGGIAVLTFSEPPVNLYSLELHDAFDVALDEVMADPPRALLIRAEGKIVSGGVDVAQFHARRTKAETLALYDRMLELPTRIDAMPFPTFFAAHALTLTWAFEVAVACDIILASEKAKFGLVERVIGLTPTMGGTQRLAARAGVGRAKEFVFTGDLYDAATMERWNVVNRVLPVEGFDDAVLSFVRSIAVGPTKAFGAAKDILRHFEAGGVPQAIEHTTAIASELFDTDDLQHGMESFLTNGPGRATFEGR